MHKNNIFAIDMGSKKIACFYGAEEHGQLSVKSSVVYPSYGIKNGSIADYETVNSAMSSLLYEAEKVFANDISEVLINYTSRSLELKKIKVRSRFNDRQVQKEDLIKILSKARQNFSQKNTNKEIFDVYFLSHEVAGLGKISDPEYIYVKELVSIIAIISVAKNEFEAYSQLLRACHLKPTIVLSNIASSKACLLKHEMKDSVVVDVGDGTTDFTYYSGGKIVNIGTVPMGGGSITGDIAKYFGISLQEAEDLKIKYSNLIDQTPGIYIQTSTRDGKNKIIDKKLLNSIIKARFEEIIEVILKKIGSYNDNTIFIITGGSCNINGLQMLLLKKYNINSKIRGACDIRGIDKEKADLCIESPEFSTIIGVLKNYRSYILSPEEKQKKFGSKIWQWLKDHF